MATLSQIRLRYYSDDEVRKLAVVKVHNASTYDRGVPKIDGINDPRLGVVDHTVRCPTCYKANCDQHFGYVELARPVYRLGTVNTVMLILRCVCRECARPKFRALQDGLDDGPDGLTDVTAILELPIGRERLRQMSEVCRSKLTCMWCGAPQPTYTKRDRTFIDAVYKPKDLNGPFVAARGKTYVDFLKARFMPDDAAAVMHALTTRESLRAACVAMGVDRPIDFMASLQLVPPPLIRPSNFAGESKVRSENDLTTALQDIIRVNLELAEALRAFGAGGSAFPYDPYDKLQVMHSGMVNHAIKKTAAQKGLLPLVTAANKRKVVDIKTRLNGKKARVRGNLNGKRVDQSGRTVISGDASHDIDQLGVPRAMMNKLTFPETVTALNRFDMEATVIRGPYVDNGALAVRQPNASADHIIWLPVLDRDARVDLAAQLRHGWVVERHLRNGDWVLFNRQPSLWKASMMAFRCYRVAGLTVRLPLPVTRAFNADFDGDEMNIHALQGYAAIAEAQELMSVPNQMVTPQSNTIIIGLVQDALVGAYRMTKQDMLLGRDRAFQLLSCIQYDPCAPEYADMQCDGPAGRAGLPAVLALPQPAILKGFMNGRAVGPIWTGKQIVSCMLPKGMSTEKTRSGAGPGGPYATLDQYVDQSVVVRNGLLLSGRLCKQSLGASNTGVPHAVWRLHGPWATAKFVSDAQRMFVRHLSYDGPSISIMDCLAADEESIRTLLGRQLGRTDALLLDAKGALSPEVKEAKSSQLLQETLRGVGASVLEHVRPDSALACCVNSGSKGNVMNIAQIAGCVGQQTIYGRRVPVRQTRLGPRTLAYYAPGDMRAEARGFVVNSYMLGLTPAEFFAHQMAGREGIVATAVNTADSGYNQRRMIKGQESQCLVYDGSVRVSSNVVVQPLYGGDDLDGSRLERVRLPWLLQWRDALGPLADLPVVATCVAKLMRYSVWRANLFKDLDLMWPCAINLGAVAFTSSKPRPATDDACATALAGLQQRLQELHARVHASTTALLLTSVACTVVQVAHAWQTAARAPSTESIVAQYSKALAHAGEGVGALGASSIGEPSMQLTLNVFHYSGIASKNVTITGLPRFKQLINAVDTYESANMTAAIVHYDMADLAVDVQTVYLYQVMADVSGPMALQAVLTPLQIAMATAYFKTVTGTGPILAKLKVVRPGGGLGGAAWCVIKIALDWTACARQSVTSDAVCKSLREAFGADGFVITMPHWASRDIYVALAPGIGRDVAEAVIEALKQQHQVKGLDYVRRAVVLQDKTWTLGPCSTVRTNGRHVVDTEGSNVVDLAKSDVVDATTIATSNVLEAARVWGITAGLTVLQSELHKVLSFDSAYIDPRHTWLLADTMGRTGNICAMNRHHMENLGSSLLQRASFEQSLDVFEDGAIFGKSDPLAGATERIILGQPVSIGTGLVGVVAEKSEAERPTVVAPAAKRRTEAAAAVRPFGQLAAHAARFDANVFGERIADMPRTCDMPFAEACVTQFRALAASRRAVPRFSFSRRLTAGGLRAVQQTCRDYALWTSVEPMALHTVVYFEHNGHSCVTTIVSGIAGAVPLPRPVTRAITTLEESAGPQATRALIWTQDDMAPHTVPVSVQPERVTLRQQCSYQKGPWTLRLVKEWTAANNVEAERAMLTQAPQDLVVLEATDPDAILQSRCSAAQLANAILARVPAA